MFEQISKSTDFINELKTTFFKKNCQTNLVKLLERGKRKLFVSFMYIENVTKKI